MASKRAQRRRACRGKIRHADEDAAWAAARKLAADTGHQLYPYKCSFCGGWHIGHDPRRTANRFQIFSGQRRGK